MRSFLGGLLGLCLGLALLPDVASARTDARSSAQNAASSRPVAAARPATSRATTTTANRTRQATAPRAATAPRNAQASRSLARSGATRHAAVPYARQPAAQAPRGLRQTAVASCTTRNGRRVCAPAATRTASFRWTGGLAPAAMSQAGCPDGTIATMAFGHNDITRCVPL